MKIVFDCRYTRVGRHDGISRYTAGVVSALAELVGPGGAAAGKHTVTMLISDKKQLDKLPDLPWKLASSPTSPREPLVALQVNSLEPDVVFTPMQTMGTFGRKYPLALTVHDLIYYSNPTPPREFAWPLRLLWRLYHVSWWPQRMLLNRADAVVTVSRTTEALVEEHHLTKRPIVVVSNAADELEAGVAASAPEGSVSVDGSERASTAPTPRSKSLVYMGSFMPYKNVETLVRAMALLPDYELHLMSTVRDADRARLSALAPSAKLVFHNGASDAEYVAELDRATALVTASLDEGFGIPLVEAMGRGTPVVVSDIAVFREIGGEAGLYFEASSPEQLVAKVRELENAAEWAARSSAGRVQAATFSWAASAQALLGLLERLPVLARSRGRR
ncbi:glycosyltransferase family 4 protein [Subtercola endophyticus]|uniref:glycosyltransferase family 4 protein n=1 Tax=Subtercola endophyticus TaxID=2895559 RepID=UPI001E3A84DE|nr:glycosyltransferase family 1 protein [Subtercola endophyticus]UFS60367.1 glycosyltransferase family 4 protein [Subtercola endophyticus]